MSTAPRQAPISMASDVLFQAMQLLAPAGARQAPAASPRHATLASDALMYASKMIARFGASGAASNRVKDLAGVRAMASRVSSTDHRFASDLLAAADRHERESETLR